jgi:hypothetical protein
MLKLAPSGVWPRPDEIAKYCLVAIILKLLVISWERVAFALVYGSAKVSNSDTDFQVAKFLIQGPFRNDAVGFKQLSGESITRVRGCLTVGDEDC